MNAELHYLKYQLKNAEQRSIQLQQTCDQQARELEKSKAARNQLAADVKSLSEQNRQLLQQANGFLYFLLSHQRKPIQTRTKKTEQLQKVEPTTKKISERQR